MLNRNAARILILGGFALAIGLTGCSGPKETQQLAHSPQIVAILDRTPLTLSEFEHQYVRTTGGIDPASSDSLADYEDFLERYVNYRLKVLEAESAGLQDDPQIQEELTSYRAKFARPYLLDQEVIDPIIQKMFDRRQSIVEASHILISVEGNTAADSAAARDRVYAIRDSVHAGVDFGELAVRHSDDPSSKDASRILGYRGYLGYFGQGTMVGAFEDHAWKTPTGEVSPVFSTRFGYHILTVHDRKDAPGDVRLAHIMITPKGDAPEDTLAALARVDSVLTRMDAGEEFGELAKVYSDDTRSGQNGGDLGWVPFESRLLPEIKIPAFELEDIGDSTPPILTQYGYHIVRLSERRDRKGFEESYEELKQKATNSSESKQMENDFVQRVYADRGMTMDTTALLYAFGGIDTDSIVVRMEEGAISEAKLDTVVATLGDMEYTARNFASQAKWGRYGRVLRSENEKLKLAIEQFLHDEAINLEVAELEEQDDELRETMNEFRNGILLFRLMEDSVWTAAASDTAALEMMYNENPDHYRYPTRTRVVSVFGNIADHVQAAIDSIGAGYPIIQVLDSLNRDQPKVRVDTTYLAEATGSIYDKALELDEGVFSTPESYNRGFISVMRSGVDEARGKTFEEARAELTNKYQEILEDRLIARLRKKYGVVTYPERLVNAFSEDDETRLTSGN